MKKNLSIYIYKICISLYSITIYLNTFAVQQKWTQHCKSTAVQSLTHVQQVVSDSLRPHGLQHTGFPILHYLPGVCSNSCPLSWWCYPTISSSVVPFSSCLQSSPGPFPMSQLFVHDGVSNYWSFSFSLSSSNEYSGLISFRIDCFDLLAVQETLKSPV